MAQNVTRIKCNSNQNNKTRQQFEETKKLDGKENFK